jgi:hypothetical protein
MHKFLVARAALILLFAIVTLLQIFSFPGQFAHMRRVEGISLLLEILLTALVALLLLSAQLSIFFIWKLIGFMQQNRFFTGEASNWINRLVGVLKLATLLPLTLILVIAPQADDPGVLVLLIAISLFVFSTFLIASLLRDQIRIKTE